MVLWVAVAPCCCCGGGGGGGGHSFSTVLVLLSCHAHSKTQVVGVVAAAVEQRGMIRNISFLGMVMAIVVVVVDKEQG